MNKRTAYIPITSCKDCPFRITTPYPTSDSWERAENWLCGKMKGVDDEPRKIQGYVEWNDEKDIEIPKWCPLTTK